MESNDSTPFPGKPTNSQLQYTTEPQKRSTRVCYHELAKWVAKLRSLKSTRQPLIFKCEMDAGHAGKSDRYDQWRDEAKVMAFLLALQP
ncbi:MAG: hypothetical protein D4R44_06005 [Actinobacteria bacterium]|nr:MAG: hypothetical protein D4R44_06005 [Actinomycetota bacterium]